MKDAKWERTPGSIVKREWQAQDGRAACLPEQPGYECYAVIHLLGRGSIAGNVVKDGKPWLLETRSLQRCVDTAEGLRVIETREAAREYHLATYEEAVKVGNRFFEQGKEEAEALGLLTKNASEVHSL